MSKKVLIVSSSLRAGSNSELLAEEAELGAKEAGNETELISLKGRDLHFCRGCLACQKTMKCVIRDDMDSMIDKVRDAEVLIFVTPIYYYELSGQLKTFLDRCNPLFPQKNAFRDVYLITTCADESNTACEKAVSGINGWIDCFDGVRFAGSLCGAGVNDAGEMKKHPDLLKAAYDLGRNV